MTKKQRQAESGWRRRAIALTSTLHCGRCQSIRVCPQGLDGPWKCLDCGHEVPEALVRES